MAKSNNTKVLFRSHPGVDAETTGPFASVFLNGDEDAAQDESDFRQVPASDKGNSSYSDMGQRGSYAPRDDDFPDPEGLVRFAGYGASEADLAQGFVTPSIHADPAYDLISYKNRWTEGTSNNEDFENTGTVPSDYEFRSRNRTTRGMFKRPHIPTER